MSKKPKVEVVMHAAVQRCETSPWIILIRVGNIWFNGDAYQNKPTRAANRIALALGCGVREE